MAASNQEVLDFVQSQLAQHPGIGTRELYRMAYEEYPSLEAMSPQSFHGRFFLTAKRALHPRDPNAAPRPRKKPARGKKGKRNAAKVAAPAVPAEQRAPAHNAAAESTGADTASARERARAAFLAFARDFASAESRADIVQVLSKVDDYVDQVVRHS